VCEEAGAPAYFALCSSGSGYSVDGVALDLVDVAVVAVPLSYLKAAKEGAASSSND